MFLGALAALPSVHSALRFSTLVKRQANAGGVRSGLVWEGGVVLVGALSQNWDRDLQVNKRTE